MERRNAFSKLKTGTIMIPIINVAFIIILILMLIMPFLGEGKIKIELPEALSDEVQEERKITLTISEDGEWELEDRRIDRSELGVRLKERLTVDLVQMLVIRADKDVLYKWVREALETAKASGIAKIAIATKPKEQSKDKGE